MYLVCLWPQFAQADVTPFGSLRATSEAMSHVGVDADGNQFALLPGGQASLRAGLKWQGWQKRLAIELEGEVVAAGHADTTDGDYAPYENEVVVRLRRANVRGSLTEWLHVTGGATMAHWGMGLVANSGDATRDVWAGQFHDATGGDSVLRAQVIAGPFTNVALRGIATFDYVLQDDLTVAGDDAKTASFAVMATGERQKKPWQAGAYIARRWQQTDAWNETRTWVGNVAASWQGKLCCGTAKVDVEAVYVHGDSDVAPNIYFLAQDVRQFGAAFRAGWHGSRWLGADWGYVADVVFASGDDNPYDDQQRALRTDPNFATGLLLFRNVVAAQTARSQVTASDPELSGYPALGVERLPTRGGMTNTLTVFPRVVMQHGAWQAYGGALLGFAPEHPTDPFNTRILGDTSKNALGGTSGQLWGVETDVGARYETTLHKLTAHVALEAGVLVPGSAFAEPEGSNMQPVVGGRLLAGVAY